MVSKIVLDGNENQGDPTVGAGQTGIDIPLEDLGPVGAQKLLIVDDIYSPLGTEVHRLSGDYVLGQGGAQDIFRDFLGKVWTKTDAAPGSPSKLQFLNPKMGDGSANVALNQPCNVYVDVAQLVDDQVWPEYSQKVYIDPDPGWLYDTLAPAFFPNEDLSIEVRSVVIQALQDPSKTFVDLDANVAKKAIDVIEKIRDWWKKMFKFETAPDAPTGEGETFASTDNFMFADLGPDSSLINFGPSYEDYNFVISTPFSPENASTMLGLKPLIASLDSVYNFYINEYECLVGGDIGNGVKEQILPNIYAFISAYVPEKKGNELNHTSKKFNDLISLNNLLQGYDASSLVTTPYKFGKGQNLLPAASNNYYRAWSSTLNTASPDDLSTLSPLVKRYTNLLFPMNDTGMLKYYNNLRFMFPMYNSLKFSTSIITQFADLFRTTHLAQHFMHYYFVKEYSGNQPESVKKKQNFIIQEDIKTVPPGSDQPPTNNIIISDKEATVMSLEAWMASMELFDVIGEEDDFGVDLSLKEMEKTFVDQNAVFMTTNKNEDLINVNSSQTIHRSLLASMLFGKARKIAKSYIRDYGELCQGKTAYSETLMYKVQKSAGSEDGTPVQTFYFLNSSEIDVLNFIDTQVSYNARYTYEVSAIQLVLGTEYRYHVGPTWASEKGKTAGTLLLANSLSDEDQAAVVALKEANEAAGFGEGKTVFQETTFVAEACAKGELTPPGNPYFGLKHPCGCAGILIKENITAEVHCAKDPNSPCCVKTQPSDPGMFDLIQVGTSLLTSIPVVFKPAYNIVETPYTKVEGRILDKPPVFPDVNIVPYKGINNKVLVNLNSSVGEYEMMPIAFNGEEEDEIALLREAQQVTDDTQPIKFKSDDSIGHGGFFQIYKMEKRPETYRDFDKYLSQTLRTRAGQSWAESAAFVDDIEPNKKYYYTFRVVDVHGNSSNPTEVFEIEMIDEGGTVYFRQRIIELKPTDEKAVTIPLKKYIHIKPTMAQGVLDLVGMDVANANSAFDYNRLQGNKGPPQLGLQSEAVWGKKFKIRFTSKATGKQIDLNINFKVTHEDKLELVANQMKDAAVVAGVQASAGGVVNPIDMEKSGQAGKPLEGL